MSIFILQDFYMIWLEVFAAVRLAQIVSAPRLAGRYGWTVMAVYCAAVAGCVVYLRGEWLLYIPSFFVLLLFLILSVKLFSTLQNAQVFFVAITGFFAAMFWMWLLDVITLRTLTRGLSDLSWLCLTMGLQTAITATCLYVIQRNRALLHDAFTNRKGWSYYLLVLLPFVVVLIAFATWVLDTSRFYHFLAELVNYFSLYESEALRNLLVFGLLTAGSVLLLMVFLLNQIMRLNRVQNERALILSRNEALFHSYMGVQRYYHDMKNHLDTLQYLLGHERYPEVRQYLDEILQDKQAIFQAVSTGEPFVDAILNSKIGEARRCGIRVRAEVGYPRNADIAAMDLCAVLANLLDNAIEACGGVEDGEIRIRINHHNQFLTVRISNSVARDPFTDNPRLTTTKSGEEFHGIGLRSVRMAVRKYNGSIKLAYEEGMFVADLMLCYHLKKLEENGNETTTPEIRPAAGGLDDTGPAGRL